MPVNDAQWFELKEVFSDTLQTLMSEVWDEAQSELNLLAVRAVGYWKLALAGDKDAEKALGSVRRQAALVVGRYLRDAEQVALEGVLNAIEVALGIGLKVLMKVAL
jgi:hypothetical protein